MTEAELRILAERWQLERIHVEDEYAVLTYRSARRIETLARLRPGRVRVVDEKTAYVPLATRSARTARSSPRWSSRSSKPRRDSRGEDSCIDPARERPGSLPGSFATVPGRVTRGREPVPAPCTRRRIPSGHANPCAPSGSVATFPSPLNRRRRRRASEVTAMTPTPISSDEGSGTALMAMMPLTGVKGIGIGVGLESNTWVLLPVLIETVTGPASVCGPPGEERAPVRPFRLGGAERITKPGMSCTSPIR